MVFKRAAALGGLEELQRRRGRAMSARAIPFEELQRRSVRAIPLVELQRRSVRAIPLGSQVPWRSFNAEAFKQSLSVRAIPLAVHGAIYHSYPPKCVSTQTARLTWFVAPTTLYVSSRFPGHMEPCLLISIPDEHGFDLLGKRGWDRHTVPYRASKTG